MATLWQHYVDFLVSKGDIDEVMIISSDDGALWACNPDSFYLREYPAMIVQEDGTEKEETVNEANSIIKITKAGSAPHGLRLNGGRKQQMIKNFKDEETGQPVIYGKFPQGGSCVLGAGKCIIIATFSEAKGHTAAACNQLVRLMAVYLFKSTWPDGDEGTVIASGSVASWQSYVDQMLIAKGNIAQALICAKADGALWASTPEFGLTVHTALIAQEDGTDQEQTVDEAKNLLQLSKGSKPLQGLRINKVKYQVIKSFDDPESGCYTILGKKSLGGCCIMVTDKAIVLSTFSEAEGHNAAACNAVMAELGKYLKSMNS